ncbi:MFS transporter, partial [Chloroflexota bacterium]
LAIGTGGINVVLISNVSRWFSKKRGLAVGIVSSGSGLGILIMSPVIAYLIENFSWRTSYILMGLTIWLVVISLSMLLKRNPHNSGLTFVEEMLNEDKAKLHGKELLSQATGFSLLQAVKIRKFWIIGFAWLLLSVCVHLILTHIIPHITDADFSTPQAATVLGALGAFTVVGRLLGGGASDFIGRRKVSVISALLGAGALLFLMTAQELWAFYLFSILFGLSWGGLGIMIPAIIIDTFGLRNIGFIMGSQNVAWVLGEAIGPYVGGFNF